MINPFNITKAVDYTDFDIEKYWVDFGNTGFKEFLKPNSPKPMLIIGSKGSGKTHMLKYFSYELQKIRYKEDYSDILTKDKYLGIFMRCSGINSERFKGKTYTEEQWLSIFGYYLDLWFAQKLLRIIQDFNIPSDQQVSISNEIIKIFNKFDGEIPKSFDELLSLFIDLQKDLDYNIDNIGFIEVSNVKIAVSFGRLIFGIPQIFEKELQQFKGVNFLYIIDEFENITENQQRLINSLYREKELPVSFRISGRPYAYKTYKTLGSGEENVYQSEYERAILDDLFREDPVKYKNFIIQMSLKKLEQNGYNITQNQFFDFFEEFSLNDFYLKCNEKANKYYHVHLRKLSDSLRKIKYKEKEITTISKNLIFEKDLLIEKVNLILFYREWKKNDVNLVEISKQVKKSAEQYFKTNDKKSDIGKVLSYYKDDLLDQLAKESQESFPSYVGIDNFIKLSSGIPRTFLNLMKNSFENAYFESGKIPFKECVISLHAQEKAIKEASEWFFDENRIPFITNRVYSPSKILNNICNYLRALRFSDLPPECSINLFSIDITLFKQEYLEVIKILEEYSYLIKSNNRLTKNNGPKNETFFINGTIAAYYNIAISKRGVVNFQKDVLEAIFNDDKDGVIKDKVKNYNAPFESEEFQRKQLKLLI